MVSNFSDEREPIIFPAVSSGGTKPAHFFRVFGFSVHIIVDDAGSDEDEPRMNASKPLSRKIPRHRSIWPFLALLYIQGDVGQRVKLRSPSL